MPASWVQDFLPVHQTADVCKIQEALHVVHTSRTDRNPGHPIIIVFQQTAGDLCSSFLGMLQSMPYSWLNAVDKDETVGLV